MSPLKPRKLRSLKRHLGLAATLGVCSVFASAAELESSKSKSPSSESPSSESRISMSVRAAPLLDALSQISLLSGKKISELPVVARDGCPLGIVDVTDVVGLPPDAGGDDASKTGTPTIRIFPDSQSRVG